MTRLKTLTLAGALALAVASSFSGLAMARGAGGGDGGLILNDVPPTVQINLPTYPQPMQNQATTSRECTFELLRGHTCAPRRGR